MLEILEMLELQLQFFRHKGLYSVIIKNGCSTMQFLEVVVSLLLKLSEITTKMDIFFHLSSRLHPCLVGVDQLQI